MDVARDLIDLFSEKELSRAPGLWPANLTGSHAERQEEERRIRAAVDDRHQRRSSFVRGLLPSWSTARAGHRGVIGIAATRVVERYHRPALVISRDGEEAFGSGRSIRPFSLA